ncbi:hypothetical protein DERF_009419, partial [Dermatophagoides farinae]
RILFKCYKQFNYNILVPIYLGPFGSVFIHIYYKAILYIIGGKRLSTMQYYSLQVPCAEMAANKLLEHWSNLRSMAIDQDITVISILVAIMLLLHCIAYSKI